ncbi:MAG: Crp/Fnr family transcriptional regulator [Novosphingobium sp.]
MSDFGVPTFTELVSEQVLAQIRAGSVRRAYVDGERLHDRGDAAGAIDLVVAGQVNLFRLSPNGQETFVGTVNPGQNYGDFAITGTRRSHRGVAVGPTTVDHLPREAGPALLADAAVVGALYRIAAFRLAQALEMLDDMRSLPPLYQLARLLLRLLQTAGSGRTIAIRQEDLAGMLGLSAVTMGKLLAALRDEGLVETGYRRIGVSDPARLAQWIAAFVQE